RDDVVAQLIAGALEFGEALEDDRQRARRFSGTHHVDVEVAEVLWMRRQTVRQRLPALQHAQHVEHDETESLALGQLGGDAQRAIERHARVQKRGKLLREEQDDATASAAEARQLDLDRSALGCDTDVDWCQALFPQFASDGLFAIGRQTPGAQLAIARYGAKEEGRHLPTSPLTRRRGDAEKRDFAFSPWLRASASNRQPHNSCVTLRTSSTLVMPLSIFIHPSSRKLRMPLRRAARVSTVASSPLTIILRISSLISIISKIPMRC